MEFGSSCSSTPSIRSFSSFMINYRLAFRRGHRIYNMGAMGAIEASPRPLVSTYPHPVTLQGRGTLKLKELKHDRQSHANRCRILQMPRQQSHTYWQLLLFSYTDITCILQLSHWERLNTYYLLTLQAMLKALATSSLRPSSSSFSLFASFKKVLTLFFVGLTSLN